jgi:hypothetical protein
MVTGDMAVLDIASRRKDQWLFDFWKLNHEQIELGKKGGPFAYVLPTDQHDPTAMGDMLFSLQTGGVQIAEATQPFAAQNRKFAAGTIVLPAAQPYRPFLIDLMEAQHYPDLRVSPGGPPKRPYDMTGWTLPMQMGVEIVRLDQPLEIAMKPHVINEPEHKVDVPSGQQMGRVGLYVSWVANMDAGWTQWLFDRYGIHYDVLHDADLRRGDLHSKYDAIVLPDQSPNSMLHGWQPGAPPSGPFASEFGRSLPPEQRPEYSGGVGLEGALALQKFTEDGGRLVAMGSASDFAIQQFGLPARNLLAGVSSSSFYGPGSLLRIDVDPNLPETHGMQANSVAFFVDSDAFQLWDPNPPSGPLRYEVDDKPKADPLQRVGDHDGIRVLATYAKSKPLLSGWLLGEDHITGKIAAASLPFGKGRVVLIGFRCQFRGQSENTYPLLFNSLLVPSTSASSMAAK